MSLADRARAALKALVSGGPHDQLVLDQFATEMGLRRPLAEYAPRTQRRYLAGARRGESARATNAREYRARKSVKERVYELADAIHDSTLESEDAHTRGVVDDVLIDILGTAHSRSLLLQQSRSMRAYMAGDKTVGASFMAGSESQIMGWVLKSKVEDFEGAHQYRVYYFYHGRFK